jgi:hypothetical protein
MNNPSLREEPVENLAPIMASRKDASILAWLEQTGRLMEREVSERALLTRDEDDIEEINALMSVEDDFEEDDDDVAE